MEQTCNRCGAPVHGLVCEYCGSLTTSLADAAAEEQAVDELHQILMTKDEKTQVKILKNGFLPETSEALIEAGVRCIPLIDADQPDDDVVEGASARLQAIVTKLKLMPDFEKKQQAVTEFESVVNAQREAKRKSDRFFNIFFLVIGLIMLCGCGGIVYIFFIQ